eukprot:Sspe_Gene.71332::Locus_42260_Transcript_1_1_Confidence_1.000_Length_460::g.71332::m.71332
MDRFSYWGFLIRIYRREEERDNKKIGERGGEGGGLCVGGGGATYFLKKIPLGYLKKSGGWGNGARGHLPTTIAGEKVGCLCVGGWGGGGEMVMGRGGETPTPSSKPIL